MKKDLIEIYKKQALGKLHREELSDGSYVFTIPGFPGLLVNGQRGDKTRQDFASALHDWITLSIERGAGLPPIK